MVARGCCMQAVRSVVRHLDGVTALAQALAQVLGGFGFVFDHQDFHVKSREWMTYL